MDTNKLLGKSLTVDASTHGKRSRFAWLPKRMDNGRWIWLTTYHSRRSHFRE